jgi:hypothetical protein
MYPFEEEGKFKIEFGPQKIKLTIGEDIEIVGDPVATENGFTYEIKCISEKAKKAIEGITNKNKF